MAKRETGPCVWLSAGVFIATSAVIGCAGSATDNGTGVTGGAGAAAAGTTGGAGSAGNPTAGIGGSAAGGLTGTAGSSGGAAGRGGGGGGASTGSSGTAGGGRGGGSGGNAGGGTAGRGGTGGASGALALTGLTITTNPNMTISCFVAWTTAVPASSQVDFGETTATFRIRDAALVTQHKVLVIGMQAGKKYLIRAVSSTGTDSGSADGTFTTGSLPSGIPLPRLTVSDFASSHVGWTLMNIQSSFSAPAVIVMYDQNGVPVWYFVHGKSGDGRGDVYAELLPSSVLVGPTSGEPAREVDLSGKVIWEGPANTNNAQLQTHVTGRTSVGYLLNRELDKVGTAGSTKIDGQLLQEIKPDLSVNWSWNLFDHVTPAGTREEICHGNTLRVDEAGGFVYYNCRYLGLFKIARASGNILWRLGGTFDKTSLGPGDFTFSPATSQFSDAHDPEVHADGTILLYDNGGFASGQTFHSRVVEYQVDQTRMTATATWEFPGTFSVDAWYKNSWYAPYWGDADRLPNGNVLITAGVRSASTATRVFEVTRAGKVVWEMTFPSNYGTFQSDRLSPPPLVETIP